VILTILVMMMMMRMMRMAVTEDGIAVVVVVPVIANGPAANLSRLIPLNDSVASFFQRGG
jgi:hypothetical protein